MNCILKSFCFLWILCLHVNAKMNYTFTYDIALHCKEHLCRHGYSYETFYHIDSNDRRAKEPGVLFEMHIAILAASNGHIVLSTVPMPDAQDPVYEIVVGGGGNKFTELRRNLRKNAKVSVPTVGVLSAVEMKPFYIKILEDGIIEFGREGEILPLISYTDSSPLSIKYFSFAAWSGVEAKFLYDCPMPGDNYTKVPNSKAVEPKMSNSDRLIQSLLYYRDPNLPIASEITVNVDLRITSVSYNEFDSILILGASVILKWTDNSIAWNPNKFNGTSHLILRQGLIWSPILFVYDDLSGSGPKNSEPITVFNSGDAILHMQISTKSWCSGNAQSITKWPRDQHLCSIIIEPWEVHDKILLKLMKNNSQEIKVFTELEDVVFNAWEVNAQMKVLNSEFWNSLFMIQDNVTHQSDRILLDIRLRRRSIVYSITIFTPLFALFAFVLMSFLTEPLKMERVWFYVICVIIICMGLSYIENVIPCNTIPSILVLYVTVLGGILLALLVQVAMLTKLAERLCKTCTVKHIIASKYFRTILCLPEPKVTGTYESINEGYSAQDDDDSNTFIGQNNINVEEMERDNKDKTEKMQCAEAIDRFLFFIYSVTFSIIFKLYILDE